VLFRSDPKQCGGNIVPRSFWHSHLWPARRLRDSRWNVKHTVRAEAHLRIWRQQHAHVMPKVVIVSI
jgi:hypothetical protein